MVCLMVATKVLITVASMVCLMVVQSVYILVDLTAWSKVVP